MRKVREAAKPVSFFLAIFMMVVFTPYQVVLAKMVTAETVLNAGHVNESRAYINSVILREDVTAALVSQGINVREAMVRINTLSDAEIIALADKMESLPAGGSGLGTIVGAAIIIFIVLLFTDIMGFTDIFPFVKKKQV